MNYCNCNYKNEWIVVTTTIRMNGLLQLQLQEYTYVCIIVTITTGMNGLLQLHLSE